MSSTGRFDQLIEAAYRQTLASFRQQVERGERNPAEEVAEYRRRRRDYATSLRMEHVPEEARELAERLLETHGLKLSQVEREAFSRKVTELLVRLYDAFLADSGNDQGNR